MKARSGSGLHKTTLVGPKALHLDTFVLYPTYRTTCSYCICSYIICLYNTWLFGLCTLLLLLGEVNVAILVSKVNVALVRCEVIMEDCQQVHLKVWASYISASLVKALYIWIHRKTESRGKDQIMHIMYDLKETTII